MRGPPFIEAFFIIFPLLVFFSSIPLEENPLARCFAGFLFYLLFFLFPSCPTRLCGALFIGFLGPVAASWRSSATETGEGEGARVDRPFAIGQPPCQQTALLRVNRISCGNVGEFCYKFYSRRLGQNRFSPVADTVAGSCALLLHISFYLRVPCTF